MFSDSQISLIDSVNDRQWILTGSLETFTGINLHAVFRGLCMLEVFPLSVVISVWVITQNSDL